MRSSRLGPGSPSRQRRSSATANRARERGEKPLGHTPGLGHVRSDHPRELAGGISEPTLTVYVPRVALPPTVIRPVVLRGQPGNGVEQVGDPDQPPLEIVDGPVHERRRKARVENPDEPQVGLARAPAAFRGQRPGRADERSGPGPTGKVAIHPA